MVAVVTIGLLGSVSFLQIYLVPQGRSQKLTLSEVVRVASQIEEVSKVKKLKRQAFKQFEIVALFTPCCFTPP